jgi:hypothetical protein
MFGMFTPEQGVCASVRGAVTRRHEVLSWAVDSILIFAAAALLVGPMFTMAYTTNWASIESTFIADARFLVGHLPHPGWQPLWYGGTRWDYIYPPALRYSTALVSKLFGVETVVAYHAYTSFVYCLGIAGVYALVRAGSSSRRLAVLAAAATALVSPSFLFLPELRHNVPWWTPQRLNVLVRWGEGPHISSLGMIGFALAASHRALERRRPLALAFAAVFCAAAVAHNFYGAIALSIFFPVLVWSIWIARPDWRVLARTGAIVALAYGLSAWWLSPSYLRITADNLSLVAQPGNAWSRAMAVVVTIVFAVASWKLGNRRPERSWPVFVSGSLILYSLNVLGSFYWGFRVTGEPIRLVPELDLAMILLAVLVFGFAWNWSSPMLHPHFARGVAFACAILAFSTSARYVTHAWRQAQPDPSYRERVEYRIADWVARNALNDRNFVMGAVRFWYDAWNDLPQFGGGSEQGVLNQKITPTFWEVRLAPDPKASILWLQCFGTDLVTVSDERSEDPYHDYPFPKKFDGVLLLAFDDGKGTRIYRVPRRYSGLARVVRLSDVAQLTPTRNNADVERLQPYADAVEKGPDVRPSFEWRGTDEMRVRARYAAGDALLIQQSFDPNWHAEANGQPLKVRPDLALGQMIVETPPGQYEVRLHFPTPLENRIGWILTALAALSCAALAWTGLFSDSPANPTVQPPAG